jgi:single-stranded-DNA-specific exonuclease
LQQYIVGQKHLSLVLKVPGRMQNIRAICFQVDTEAWPNPSCQRIEAIYRLQMNEYEGRRQLQMIISHLQAV